MVRKFQLFIFLLLFIPRSTCQANPITDAGGAFLDSSIVAGPPDQLVLEKGVLSIVIPEQPPTAPDTDTDGDGDIPIGDVLVGDLTVDLTSFTTNNVLGNVDLSDLVITIKDGGPDDGLSATLEFVPGSGLLNENGGSDQLTAIFQLTDDGGITALDFGPVGGQFVFDTSFQGITFNSGNQTVTGTPATSSFGLERIAAVPEPTSLALWGVVGVGGAFLFRRRRAARTST